MVRNTSSQPPRMLTMTVILRHVDNSLIGTQVGCGQGVGKQLLMHRFSLILSGLRPR
jgi:hypothetical protein